jgi:hypothetical protein
VEQQACRSPCGNPSFVKWINRSQQRRTHCDCSESNLTDISLHCAEQKWQRKKQHFLLQRLSQKVRDQLAHAWTAALQIATNERLNE